MTGHQGNITFKVAFIDLEGQRTFSQNKLDNIKVKCIKFEVSTLISFKVIHNQLRKRHDIKEI